MLSENLSHVPNITAEIRMKNINSRTKNSWDVKISKRNKLAEEIANLGAISLIRK